MICKLGLTLYSFEFVFKRAKAKGNNGYQRFSQFQLVKVLYTAHAHTTGGREGRSVSDDGLLDIKLAPPKELGGMGGATNPEQLFAAGYSACFMGAMKHVAGMKKSQFLQTLRLMPALTLAQSPQVLALQRDWRSACLVWTAQWPKI